MAQQLFTDIPASASNIPGMVTPNISADIQPRMNIQDLATAYALQQRMKKDREDAWARASAMNSANLAQANAARSQPHYLPGTESQASGMGKPQSKPGSVMWAPRNLNQSQLGKWTSQEQNRAMSENREMPTVVQAHTNDPYSPGEQGSGGQYLDRGIYGPGFTGSMGTADPRLWAKLFM